MTIGLHSVSLANKLIFVSFQDSPKKKVSFSDINEVRKFEKTDPPCAVSNVDYLTLCREKEIRQKIAEGESSKSKARHSVSSSSSASSREGQIRKQDCQEESDVTLESLATQPSTCATQVARIQGVQNSDESFANERQQNIIASPAKRFVMWFASAVIVFGVIGGIASMVAIGPAGIGVSVASVFIGLLLIKIGDNMD